MSEFINTSYPPVFPNEIAPDHTQVERTPGNNDILAESRDYNILNTELIRTQQYIGINSSGNWSPGDQTLSDIVDSSTSDIEILNYLEPSGSSSDLTVLVNAGKYYISTTDLMEELAVDTYSSAITLPASGIYSGLLHIDSDQLIDWTYGDIVGSGTSVRPNSPINVMPIAYADDITALTTVADGLIDDARPFLNLGGGGGAGASDIFSVSEIAASGQTVFDVTFGYKPGANELDVHIDGKKQHVLLGDYLETDQLTITTTAPQMAGAEVLIEKLLVSGESSGEGIGLITYTGIGNGTVNPPPLTGDWTPFQTGLLFIGGVPQIEGIDYNKLPGFGLVELISSAWISSPPTASDNLIFLNSVGKPATAFLEDMFMSAPGESVDFKDALGLARSVSVSNSGDIVVDGEPFPKSSDLSSTSSGKGAFLIGIEDFADSFTSDNVEDLSIELNNKIDSIGSSSLKYATGTYTGNGGSARTISLGLPGGSVVRQAITTRTDFADWWRIHISSMPSVNAISNTAVSSNPALNDSLTISGADIIVGTDTTQTNSNTVPYRWVVFYE